MQKQVIKPSKAVRGETRCSAMDFALKGMYPGFFLAYREKLDPVRLGRALARVLEDYSIFAGRFLPEAAKRSIRHGQGGVMLECVSTTSSIAEVEAFTRSGVAQSLDPKLSHLRVMLGREVLVAARLTQARDGSVLSVTWDHALGDMHTTMLLMRAWNAAYEETDYAAPAAISDRDAYLREHIPDPPAARSAVRLTSWATVARSTGWLLRPGSCVNLEYSWEQIEQLRAAFSKNDRVTPNDVMCAHLYFVLRRLTGTIDPANLCLSVNYRKRIGLPENVMGNLVGLLPQRVDEVDSVADIAAGLRARLDEYASKHVDYHASMRVFDAHPKLSQRIRVASRFFEPLRGDLLVTNWNNFGTYDLKYGTSGPSFFCPLMFGAFAPRPWCMVVYDLPARAGLGFVIGASPLLAERLKSREGQALLACGSSSLAPVRQTVS